MPAKRKKVEKDVISEDDRMCPKCGDVKNKEEGFGFRNLRRSDGIRVAAQPWCRDCRKESARASKLPMKHCKSCEKPLRVNLFAKNKKNKDGYSAICKVCKKNNRKKKVAK